MMPTQKRDDIFDQLRVAADVSQYPIQDAELRQIAGRLVQYHGAALARLIASLPGRKFFPAGCQLESEIRETLGKKKLGGLSVEQIDQNEREIVVAGQPIERARAGAEMLRKTLRAKAAPPEVKPTAPAVALAMLEDFGEPASNPLDALADFE